MKKFYDNLSKEIKANTNNSTNPSQNNINLLNNRAKIWLLLGSCVGRGNIAELARLLNSNIYFNNIPFFLPSGH